MKRNLRIALFVLILVACQSRNNLEVEFEKNLPENDLILLNIIVDVYDAFIKSNYQGDAHQFFSAIVSDSLVLNNTNSKVYCELVKMFDESTLEIKIENVKYDSVFLTDSGNIMSVRKKADRDEEWAYDEEWGLDEEIRILPPGHTMEDEIEKTKKEGYWRRISDSSFISALQKISSKNDELEEYIYVKEFHGFVNPEIMASSLIEYDMNQNDYFIKRIIVIELFINQIRLEYAC